ncbi:MAG: MoaD/ThiS family protein [Nitrososphaerales archaeon]
MITVKLLGGARRALERDHLEIDRKDAKLREIVETLRSLSTTTNNLFNPGNLLIVVNGVESSSAGGLDLTVKDGDVITMVPVVHGG